MSALLAALLAVAAQDERAAVLQAVDAVLMPADRGDVEAARKGWSAASPFRDAFLAALPDAAAYGAAAPRSDPRPLSVNVRGDEALATLSFAGKWTRADEAYPDEVRTTWRVELRRENGAWAWWRVEPFEKVLARVAAEAKDDEELRGYVKEADERGHLNKRLVEALGEEGSRLWGQGRKDEGAKLHRIAARVAELSKKPLLEAAALLERGMLAATTDRTAESVPLLTRARDLGLQAGDLSLVAWARCHLAGALADQGRLMPALGELVETDAAAVGRDPDLKRMIETYFGVVQHLRKDYPEAIRWGRLSLETAGPMAPWKRAQCLYYLGWSLFEAGRLGEAEVACAEGLTLVAGTDARALEAQLKNTLGAIHLATNSPAKALTYFNESREFWKANETWRMLGTTANNLGETYRRLRQNEDAKAAFEDALRIVQKLGDRPLILKIRNNLSLVHRELGDQAAAETELNLCLLDALQRGDPVDRLLPLCNLAALKLGDGDVARANDLYDEAVRLSEDRGSTLIRYEANLGKGLALVRRGRAGDFEAAEKAAERAVGLLEILRGGLRDPQLRQSFLSEQASAYSFLADLRRSLGRTAGAFEASEQAKARTIVELMASSGPLARRMTDPERARDGELQAAISRHEVAVAAAGDSVEQQKAELALERARFDLEEYRRTLHASRPGLQSASGRLRPIGPDGLDALVRRGDRALLSYLVAGQRTILFVARPGALTAHPIEVSAGDLRAEVAAFRKACTNASLDASGPGRALYDRLLAPAEAELKGATRWIVCADDALHGLPFHALTGPDGRFLVESREIVYAPSATALAAMEALAAARRAAPRSGPAMLAAGNPAMPAGLPRLAMSGLEAEALGVRYPGSPVLVDRAASETAVKAAMPTARRIHLATHGIIEAGLPMESYLQFAADPPDDGRLRARELADLELAAELVVLSACETGKGRAVDGEGVVGLSWAIFAAGAPTTVVSLWRVEEESTPDLMKAFYDALDAPGSTGPGEALRTAQRSMMKDPERRHPRSWAPFILVGAP